MTAIATSSFLWYISSKEFRTFHFYNLPRGKRLEIVKRQAEVYKHGEVYQNQPLMTDVVGRKKEKALFESSIYYHILRHPIALMKRKAPPKMYIVKGEPGSGKSWLVQALARESYDRAVNEGFFVNFTQLEGAHLSGMYMGQYSGASASAFDKAAKSPTILFIDEAQSMFQKGANEHGDSASREYQNAESAILQALDRILKRPVRTIVVLSTNAFENIREDVRRRGFLMDLDTPGLNRTEMVEIVGKFLMKLKIDLEAEKVMETLEQALREVGEGKMVAHDIERAFDEVIAESEKPLNEAFMQSFREASE